ncbi:MAG: transglutaminase-like domain-containing protein [Oligoflexia bacterium]|nr:transglutaminase-like domain-containing protein [Oligoflexia bacterium]
MARSKLTLISFTLFACSLGLASTPGSHSEFLTFETQKKPRLFRQPQKRHLKARKARRPLVQPQRRQEPRDEAAFEQLISTFLTEVSEGPKAPTAECADEVPKGDIPPELERYLQATPMIQSDAPEIVAKAHEITRGIPDLLGKSRAIHEWVSRNVSYDKETALKRDALLEEESRQDALYTLQSGLAVCEGYAGLVAALHRAIGIPSRVVTGKFGYVSPKAFEIMNRIGRTIDLEGSSGLHAWNETFIDGRWVSSDPTSDSGMSEGSSWKPAVGAEPEFFDAPPAYFAMTHKKTDEMVR